MIRVVFLVKLLILSGGILMGNDAPRLVIIAADSLPASAFDTQEFPILNKLKKQGVLFRYTWASTKPELSRKILKSGQYHPVQTILDTKIIETDSLDSLLKEAEPFLKAENTYLFLTALQGTPGSEQINQVLNVPLLVIGPGIVAPGRECRDLVDFSDFVPTLRELSGLSKIEGDGKSFVPSLKYSDDPFLKRNWIYACTEKGKEWYIRDWQNVLYHNGRFRKLSIDHITTEPIKKTDKIAPHRKERLEMLAKRLKR